MVPVGFWDPAIENGCCQFFSGPGEDIGMQWVCPLLERQPVVRRLVYSSPALGYTIRAKELSAFSRPWDFARRLR
jgi:hypothetical protein